MPLVKPRHELPGLVGVLAPVDEVEIVWRDHPLLCQRLEIDDAVPEFATEQEDRERPDLPRLDKGQLLEQLVERAEASGEHRHRPCSKQEVHLAKGEIVELEA